MKYIKFLIIGIILFYQISFFYSVQNQQIPFIIKSQTQIFSQIAKDFKNKLPKDIELLVYNINLLNGSDELELRLNNKLYEVLYKYQNKYKYSVLFEKEIKEKYKNVKNYDLSFIERQDEEELIDFGKLLEQDAIILFSVTLIEGKTKFIGDKTSNLFIPKKIALIQGICFNTDTRTSIFKLAYYFYLD